MWNINFIAVFTDKSVTATEEKGKWDTLNSDCNYSLLLNLASKIKIGTWSTEFTLGRII